MTDASEELLEGHVEPESPGAVRSLDDLSPETRALMAEVAKQGPDDADDEAPEVEEDAEEVEAGPGEAEATEVEPAETKSEPVVDATVLSSALDQLREREKALDAKRDEIEAAEKRIADRERRMDAWKTDRLAALRDIAEEIGAKEPDAQKAWLEGLYEEMTYNVLGVEPDAETSEAKKARSETASLRRQVEELKKQQAEAERQRAEAAQRAEEEQKIAGAIRSVGGYLSDAAHEFPFLTRGSDEPGKVVWDVLNQAAVEGKELTLKEAADLAEAHFKTEAERFRDLLTPKTDETPEGTSTQRTTSHSGTRTLTNNSASAAPPPKPSVLPGDLDDDDEARAATIALLRKTIRQAES